MGDDGYYMPPQEWDQPDKMKARALCKYRGMLVIAEFAQCEDGVDGRCPECGATSFNRVGGWVECDCGFAINESDYDRMTSDTRSRSA